MVHSSLAFHSARELPHKLKELEYHWENFMLENEQSVYNQIRKDVLESWKRCQKYGVDPLQQQTNIKLSEDRLMEEINQSKLYEVSLPIIDEFYRQIKGTDHLITLGDHEGKIIHLKGDHRILSKAAEMNFIIGADWSEQAAGSNAIGTAIAAEKPIQILSSEHFCQGVHPWVCSSAPIRDPRTKRLLGVIDLTGPSTNAQPHSLSLVQNVSHIIEQSLFFHAKEILRYLEMIYLEQKNKQSAAEIVILDEWLNVVHANESALDILKINHFNEFWNIEQLRQLKHSLLSKNPFEYEWEWDISSLNCKVFIQSITYQSDHIGFILYIEKLYQYTPTKKENKMTLKGVVGQSPAMKKILQNVQIISDKNVPVLITGESGTGKEIFAHNIHLNSHRKDKPFIAINCGAIPENLITSELFGYVGGAFTGGNPKGKKGKFEEANGGTLLLDEIGEMPLDLQVHLLRVLQEKEVVPIGSSKPIPIDVRIIAATNKNLQELIENGSFRSDLYYRLNVVQLHLPPLRERYGDVELLSNYFAKELAQRHGKAVPKVSKDVIQLFTNYHWPGNIRELMNVMEYAVLFNDHHTLSLESLPASFSEKIERMNKHHELSIIEQNERDKLLQILIETNGNLSEVARRCNIARTTLYRKINKYNIKESEYKRG